MLKALCSITVILALSLPSAWADERITVEETHVHFEGGVIYCDVRTFNQEAYILKVLGSGSPMTVFWQFEVLKKRGLWLNRSVATVRLGRQVIPDLVTKRWLMRDLSGGVVRYTSDAHIAMQFLTEMNRAAIVDISILEPEANYELQTMLYMHEGEWDESSWWSSVTNWGENMGSLDLVLPDSDE
jgi:hypothetical protein